jgi:DNA-binding MarR family transcriptional regulator
VTLTTDDIMTRSQTAERLLAELTTWGPHERQGAFRAWLRGSLSLVHLHVLTVLETDGPLSMTHLADALDVSVASATGIVDRMESRGLVERLRASDDRRVVLVGATDAGRAVFSNLGLARRAVLAPLLERMTTEELEAALTGLGAMRRVRTEMADSGLVTVHSDEETRR